MAIVSLEVALLRALDLYEKEFATSKTVKYFLSGLRKETVTVRDVEYPKTYSDLVHTFLVVMTKRTQNSTVVIEGETYQVLEYVFPEKWWEVARARRVYSCPQSVAYAEPYYDFVYDPAGCRVLDPVEVSQFFARYNSNQTDDCKIHVRGPIEGFSDPVSLLDFKALCTEGDQLAYFNVSGGTVEGIVAQVLDVQHVLEDEYLAMYNQYEERSVSRWLMSVAI